MAEAERSRIRFPMRSLIFFNLPNLSSLTMVMGFTEPLTETFTFTDKLNLWGIDTQKANATESEII
jgi:hypothetical protein